jgi:hypothetical protein
VKTASIIGSGGHGDRGRDQFVTVEHADPECPGTIDRSFDALAEWKSEPGPTLVIGGGPQGSECRVVVWRHAPQSYGH